MRLCHPIPYIHHCWYHAGCSWVAWSTSRHALFAASHSGLPVILHTRELNTAASLPQYTSVALHLSLGRTSSLLSFCGSTSLTGARSLWDTTSRPRPGQPRQRPLARLRFTIAQSSPALIRTCVLLSTWTITRLLSAAAVGYSSCNGTSSALFGYLIEEPFSLRACAAAPRSSTHLPLLSNSHDDGVWYFSASLQPTTRFIPDLAHLATWFSSILYLSGPSPFRRFGARTLCSFGPQMDSHRPAISLGSDGANATSAVFNNLQIFSLHARFRCGCVASRPALFSSRFANMFPLDLQTGSQPFYVVGDFVYVATSRFWAHLTSFLQAHPHCRDRSAPEWSP